MKVNMHKQIGTAAMLGIAVFVSGCGGGGQTSLPSAAKAGGTTSGTAKATLTIKIPALKASVASAKRSPKYVSASTMELAIRTGTTATVGTAGWQIFNVAASVPANPNVTCSTDPATGIRTCVVTVTAPADQGAVDEFQITATDSPTVATDTIPTGNFLSAGNTTQTVTAGAANAVNISLTPIIGLLAVAPASYSVWASPGLTANVVASITASDFDRNVIFGQPASYANPLMFADGLTPSPFTYPSANLAANNYGIAPPETAGPVQATIVYTAPQTISVPAVTVTVTTADPGYLPALPPPATFTLHPLVVSAGASGVPGSGTAVGSLSLVTGSLKYVTVNESNAASFTVNAGPVGQTEVTLENAAGNAPLGASPLVPDVNGNAVFSVFAGVPTTAATAPTITVTDANGTVATLPVTITAAAAPAAVNHVMH
jgi:hypothetical protein